MGSRLHTVVALALQPITVPLAKLRRRSSSMLLLDHTCPQDPLRRQVDVPPDEVERKGRLMPGNIFLVDFERHAVVTDEDMKRAVSTKRPYGEWLATQTVTLQVTSAVLTT